MTSTKKTAAHNGLARWLVRLKVLSAPHPNRPNEAPVEIPLERVASFPPPRTGFISRAGSVLLDDFLDSCRSRRQPDKGGGENAG